MWTRAVAVVVALAASASALAGEKLNVGDKAPALGGKVTWVQGEPVEEFAPGKVYVLDFWATWCGPCVASIPHMNDIARERKKDGVNVIGVAVWPRPRMAPVASFVEKRGDGMSYPIAEDVDAKAAAAYLESTASQSIPTVMIVDRKGQVAWVGHPMEMDPVLAQVIDGTFDPEKTSKAALLEAEAQEKAAQGDWDGAFALIDQIIAMDRKTHGAYAVKKYMVLHARLNREADASAWGRKAVAEVIQDDPKQLNEMAWFIVDAPIKNPDFALARLAADKANELTKGSDFSILDTLAAVQFAQGEVKAALETQQEAIAAIPAEGIEVRAELEQRLAKYQKAAEGQ